MMVWVCRLMCPNGHVMAAGASEAASDESRPVLAASFLDYLCGEMPEQVCDYGCGEIDLRRSRGTVTIAVQPTCFETLEEAAASFSSAEAQQFERRFALQKFLRQSRN